MNKKIIATLSVFALTIALAIANVGALTAREVEPGSSGDPVVTKGYVDRLINDHSIHKKMEVQEEVISLLSKELNALKKEIGGFEIEGLETPTSGETIYKVVDVEAGEKLIGRQGTEIILRAGEGIALASNLGGLQDVTEGEDITQGLIPKYHLLITPRDDRRGVHVTKKATFMVRGNYIIE